MFNEKDRSWSLFRIWISQSCTKSQMVQGHINRSRVEHIINSKYTNYTWSKNLHCQIGAEHSLARWSFQDSWTVMRAWSVKSSLCINAKTQYPADVLCSIVSHSALWCLYPLSYALLKVTLETKKNCQITDSDHAIIQDNIP